MYRLIDILKEDTKCVSCGRTKKLHEAYSEKAIQGFLDKFKEEADDLNMNVSDSQLKSYIKIFDRIKEKLPGDQRDLNKWKVKDFIKFVTKGKTGDEREEAEEITPDVVYHSDDDRIVIYNGNTEGTCVKYGKGESWCITKSSWAGHRYDEAKGYPSFYLAKNKNLPSSNKLSFVVIAVRNPEIYGDKHYVLHPRDNSPHYPDPITFDELLSQAPWLREVPNLKSIIKYVPLSSQEKIIHQYEKRPMSYREWIGLPYKEKEQYLVARQNAGSRDSDRIIFSDITDNEFIGNRLVKFPDVLKFVARTPGLVKPTLLLKNLDKLPDEARKSVTSNLHTPIDTKELSSDSIPFDVKKLLVKLKKWELDPTEKLYVTKDGDTIVKLTLGDDLKMGLYQAEDDFPNVKLNKRTSKFLSDYPELDKLPIGYLINLAEKGTIDSNIVQTIIDNAKKDPNSPIAVKKTTDGELILDPNSLTAYKLKDGKINQVPFEDEEVQNAFKDAQENEEFKKGVLNLFLGEPKELPKTVNTQALASIINSLPYDQRILPIRTGRWAATETVESVALVDPESSRIFFMNARPEDRTDFLRSIRKYQPNGVGQTWLTQPEFEAFFNYLRSKNILIDDDKLEDIAKSGTITGIKNFVKAQPPLDPSNVLKPIVDDNDTVYLLNTANRRSSKKLGASGNLINAILSQSRYNQLASRLPGAQAPQAPAQEPAAAAQQQARRTYYQQPAPTGDVSIPMVMSNAGAAQQFNQIPPNDRRRLNITNGAPLNTRTDGGARRRNQLLGNAGQVVSAFAAQTSRIYVIRLANGTNVISIKVYPGNREYLLIPGQRAYSLDEPSDLLRILRQRDLAEARKYFVRSYLDTNPANLEEFKQILRKHISKKNEQ